MRDYIKDAKLSFGEYLQDLSQVKLLILDNDGVMTDCKINYVDGQQPFEISYNVLDGYGLIKLQQLGIAVAIISGRANPALEERCRILGIPASLIYSGVSNKLESLRNIMIENNLNANEIAYIGDDIIDLEVIEFLPNGITVPNSHPLLKHVAAYTTINAGGYGAVREVCDLIIIAHAYQQITNDYTKQQTSLKTFIESLGTLSSNSTTIEHDNGTVNNSKHAFINLSHKLVTLGLHKYQAILLADFLLTN